MLGTVFSGINGDAAADLFAQYQQEEPKRPTADKAAIAGLERVTIGSEAMCSGDEPCAICLEEFQAGNEATRLPCGHFYHPACIGKWLEEQDNRCPVCRHELPAQRQEPAGTSASASAAAAATAAPPRGPPGTPPSSPVAGASTDGLTNLSIRELLHLCRTRGMGEAARACLEKRELLALLRAHTIGARRQPGGT